MSNNETKAAHTHSASLTAGAHGIWHRAMKPHPCDHYFSKTCPHGGVIGKGGFYWSPFNDCKDPFHPYRVCQGCAAQQGIRQ